MSVKRIRSKRKGHAVDLSDMAKLFLYRNIRLHIDDGIPLSATDQNILREMGSTPQRFSEQWLAEAEAHQKECLHQWVEDAAKKYQDSAGPYTRHALIEALERAEVDVDEYFQQHFISNIVDLSEWKARK